VIASAAAAHVPTQREHVTSSPIAWCMPPSSGSSPSPVWASPLTNGVRMKLVTSSCESVRAALNVAVVSTTRSSGVWHCGSRPVSLLTIPAAPRPATKAPVIAAYDS
jgi:hypothetical protein